MVVDEAVHEYYEEVCNFRIKVPPEDLEGRAFMTPIPESIGMSQLPNTSWSIVTNEPALYAAGATIVTILDVGITFIVPA